jgi:hypothetical protein
MDCAAAGAAMLRAVSGAKAIWMRLRRCQIMTLILAALNFSRIAEKVVRRKAIRV